MFGLPPALQLAEGDRDVNALTSPAKLQPRSQEAREESSIVSNHSHEPAARSPRGAATRRVGSTRASPTGEAQASGRGQSKAGLAASPSVRFAQAAARAAGNVSMAVHHVSEGNDHQAAPQGLLARRRMTMGIGNPAQQGQQRSSATALGYVDLPAKSFKAAVAAGATSMRHARKSMKLPAKSFKAAVAAAEPGSLGDVTSVEEGQQEVEHTDSALHTPASSLAKRCPVIHWTVADWQQHIRHALSHWSYYLFLCITTLYILFEDDVKRAALSPHWDLPLESILTAILLAIILEMILASWVKAGYLLGFYFWLDCMVCASLLFEVPTIKSRALGLGEEPLSLSSQDDVETWAGERAFITGKAVRLARIFRVLRLLRVYTLYKRFEARRRIRAALERAGADTGGELPLGEEDLTLLELEVLQDQSKETRVGQKLEELIIRRIIILVMLCVLLMPVFEARNGLWSHYQGVDRGGLKMLHDMAVQFSSMPLQDPAAATVGSPMSAFDIALQAFLPEVVFQVGRHTTSQLLHLVIRNVTYVAYAEGVSRRYDELYYMSFTSSLLNSTGLGCVPGLGPANLQSDCQTWTSMALYDWKWYSQTAAILSISRSIFIISLLALGAWLLNRDSRVLVLEPIERMLARVTALAENPLALQAVFTAPWQEQLERVAAAQAQASTDQKTPLISRRNSSKSVQQAGGLLATRESLGAQFKQAGVDAQGVVTIAQYGAQEAAVERGSADDMFQPDSVTDGPMGAERQMLSHALAAWGHGGGGAAAGMGSAQGSLKQLSEGPGAVFLGFPRVRVGSIASLGGSMREEHVTTSTLARTRWRAAVNTVSGMAKLMHRARSHWVVFKEVAKKVLRRFAMNFWDGVIEDGGRSGNSPEHLAEASYETQLIENSIQKIGGLLAVGFGDAGAEVIAENIKNEGDINPMVPGRKIVAFFGFCDIRRFTDATEVLQEEVMEFVNSIARIVHTSVAIHGGAANKNIGDAFLLVWKLPKGFSLQDLKDACAHGHKTSLLPVQHQDSSSDMLQTAQRMTDHSHPAPMLNSEPHGPPGDSLRFSPVHGYIRHSIDSTQQNSQQAVNSSSHGPREGAQCLRFSMESCTHDEATLPHPTVEELPLPTALSFKGPGQAQLTTRSSRAVAEANEQAGTDGAGMGMLRAGSRDLQAGTGPTVPFPPRPALGSAWGTPFSMKKSTGVPPPGPRSPAPSLGAANDGRQDSSSDAKIALPKLLGSPQASSPGGPPVARIKSNSDGMSAIAAAAASLWAGTGGHGKARFMGIPDNRVLPLGSAPTDGSLPPSKNASRINRTQLSRGEASLDADEAVQRVMRVRSKAASSHGGDVGISVPEKAELVAAVADNALASFIIVHAALKRSVRLARYLGRADLMERLGQNFSVQMGFGLHVGWAIEGAIGSEYKIDASYLSPNVNMASRLEAATKQFGVSILMSSAFANCLSGDMRSRCRQIDCVTVKGSNQPMGLFTYDINLDLIEEPDPDMPGAEEEEEAFWADYALGWHDNNDLEVTWGGTAEFIAAFEKGYQAYKTGDWQAAKELLTAASDMRASMQGNGKGDPPAQVLLNYMAGFGYQSPTDWKGYRELTEK